MKRLSALLWLLACTVFSVSWITAQETNGSTPEPPRPVGPTAAATSDGAFPSGTVVATALPPGFTPTALFKPEAVTVVEQDGIVLSLYFDTLRQGRAGLFNVSGEGITAASMLFLNRTIPLFSLESSPFVPAQAEASEGFYGLVAAGIEQTPRDYPLVVVVERAGSPRATLETSVTVVLGGFIQQSMDIPPERVFLIDPPIERAEFARLASIFERSSDDRLWGDTDFALPMNSELSSPFGAVRVLNSTVQTRHTGWDLRASVGTPITASASGVVAFAGPLDIRGNHVIVDHGHGIFTGYSHMSQIHVTRGQTVTQGQILGLSGNTGRSSGPHLHWEVTVNGEFVDSVDFTRMWLPGR